MALLDAADWLSSPPQQPVPDLASYDRFVVFFSGGKDSLACVLHLLDAGVECERIELHHHLVDGREGSRLMDWPITESYSKAVAAALGLPLRMSWRQGGFEAEMLRDHRRTAPVIFERRDGSLDRVGGERGPLGTRRRFPQVSADLSVRWCSSALKIDAGAAWLRNDPAMSSYRRILVVTGERAAESPSRARYLTFERHRADRRDGRRAQRHIDHWRPVHAWTDEEVWAILEKHRINPHPAYWLGGWSRVSCMSCIFGSPAQWASLKAIAPEHFARIAAYEREFGVTIHRNRSVERRAEEGLPYASDPEWTAVALSTVFDRPVFVDPWQLPPGAHGERAGPT